MKLTRQKNEGGATARIVTVPDALKRLQAETASEPTPLLDQAFKGEV